jgi:hypothetical protein
MLKDRGNLDQREATASISQKVARPRLAKARMMPIQWMLSATAARLEAGTFGISQVTKPMRWVWEVCEQLNDNALVLSASLS